jgi:hypothetical protein
MKAATNSARLTLYATLLPILSLSFPNMPTWNTIVIAPAKDRDRPTASGFKPRPVGGSSSAKIGYSELYDMFASWKIKYVIRRRTVSRVKISFRPIISPLV